MSGRLIVALALTLVSCRQAKQGDVGCYCKPDGTCNYQTLECREPPYFGGFPLDEPSCHLKSERRAPEPEPREEK